MRWLWHKPVIRYMAFLTGGYNLVNAAAPLLLIVLGKQLGASDAEVGLIFSIGGIGGIVGSIMGGGIQRRFTFGQVIVALVWMNAALFALYAVAPSIWVLAAISAAIFVLMPIYNVVQFSYRVALIPDELQGRVNSTFRLLAFGFMPVGAALAGSLIERLGVMPALVVFILWQGVLALATTFNRHIREAPRL
jgi:predicted MFS family arabinose efflux permease